MKKIICIIFIFIMIGHAKIFSDSVTSAFNELITVNPAPVIQLKFPYNINTDYATSSTTGSGTVTWSSNFAVLQTTAASSSSATLRSRGIVNYRTGQGIYNLVSAIFTTGVANSTQIVGIGDSSDGFFFGYNGASFGIMRRVNGVDNWTAQSSWNTDKVDGSVGTSFTLDPTKGNVYKIQYQWLGFGAIRFYIENPSTGNFTLVHMIQYANANTAPSIANPSLQLMVQVANTTNTSNITLKTPAMVAFVEGMRNRPLNQPMNSASTASVKSVSTTLTNVLTIQNKATYQGIPNHVVVQLANATAMDTSGGSTATRITLYLNPTLTGTSFTEVSTNTSVVSFDTAGTISTSGRQLLTFYLPPLTAEQFIEINLSEYQIALMPGDLLMAAGAALSGTNTLFLQLSWYELF